MNNLQLGHDAIKFIVYNITLGAGKDEVLQLKLMGTTETAHIHCILTEQ